MRPHSTNTLLELADRIVERDRRLEPLATYLRLRDKGLRKQAFAGLSSWLTEFQSVSFADRRDLVDWLIQLDLEAEVRVLLPHPVHEKIIKPTLDEWIRCEPYDSAPHRWRGMLYNEFQSLEEAVELDGSDDLARHRLVHELLEKLYFATHHLPEGLLFTEKVFFEIADRAEALLDGAKDCEDASHQRKHLHWYRRRVEIWLEYKEETEPGDFESYFRAKFQDNTGS